MCKLEITKAKASGIGTSIYLYCLLRFYFSLFLLGTHFGFDLPLTDLASFQKTVEKSEGHFLVSPAKKFEFFSFGIASSTVSLGLK